MSTRIEIHPRHDILRAPRRVIRRAVRAARLLERMGRKCKVLEDQDGGVDVCLLGCAPSKAARLVFLADGRALISLADRDRKDVDVRATGKGSLPLRRIFTDMLEKSS